MLRSTVHLDIEIDTSSHAVKLLIDYNYAVKPNFYEEFYTGGELGWRGEPTTYAEFRWARGKNIAVKVVNF